MHMKNEEESTKRTLLLRKACAQIPRSSFKHTKITHTYTNVRGLFPTRILHPRSTTSSLSSSHKKSSLPGSLPRRISRNHHLPRCRKLLNHRQLRYSNQLQRPRHHPSPMMPRLLPLKKLPRRKPEQQHRQQQQQRKEQNERRGRVKRT